MTTIGYATLQIIPSLKGVTEAIEKQVDGKVVEVKVAPKVDPKAADTAGKQVKDAVEKQTTDVKVTPKVDQKAADTAGKETKAAVEKQTAEVKVAPKVDEKAAADAGKKTRETVEKQTKEIQVKPKVDKKAAEQAGKETGEAVTKGTKDAVRKGDIGKTVSDEVTKTVEKSSPGKDLAKVIIDGLADGAKAELRGGSVAKVLVDGLADGMKQGVDKIDMRSLGKALQDGIKSGNLGGTIKNAVVPGISQIGDVVRSNTGSWAASMADTLRTGGIEDVGERITGILSGVGGTIGTITNGVADIGEAFGLQTEPIREFGANAEATIGDVITKTQGIIDTLGQIPGASELASAGMNKAFEKGLGGMGFVRAAAGWSLPVTVATTLLYTIFFGDRDTAEDLKTQTSGGPGQPQLPGAGLPQGGDYAAGAVLPPDTPVPPGFEVENGKLKKKPAAPAPATAPGPAPAAAPVPPAPKGKPQQSGAENKLLGPSLPADMKLPDGFEIGPDGQLRKKSGYEAGGYTGNWPVDQIAGVVHGKEYVLQAISQQRIENDHPGLLDFMNATGRLPGYADGGLVDNAKRFAASMDPAKYLIGGFSPGAIDCSGFVSAVVNVATGRPPFQSRMSTSTEGSWLASLGFKPGRGSGGDLRVGWWDRGGGANGHTAGTLPDGTNFESNSSEGVVIGGKTGADDAQFSRHAYLPVAAIGNPNGSRSDATSAPDMLSALGLGGGGGGSPAASTSPAAAASSSSGGGITLASSISGLSSSGLGDLKGPETGPGKRTFKYGKALSSAVEGQVSSALSVFGVPDSPGWLQGLSQFVGGISIGGGGSDGYGGAAPISLGMDGAHAPGAAENMHGGNAGQQPGPGVTYNISTARVEDAFTKAQQQEKIRLASKLDRF